MKENAAKSSTVPAELASKLEDTMLELVAGGHVTFEHFTEEEIEQIVGKNVMENWFDECYTDPKAEEALKEIWRKKLVDREALKRRGGIDSIWS